MDEYLQLSHRIVAKGDGCDYTRRGGYKPMSATTQSDVNLSNSPDTDELVAAVETLAERVTELEAENERLRDELDEARDEIEANADDVSEIQQHAGRERADLSRRVSEVEQTIDNVDLSSPTPTPEPGETGVQREDLTPVERLTTDGDVSDVTTSASVERAVTIFENITDWGNKTPKGYTIRPQDNPVSLLEAARDETLSWRQWYRAAETLEQLSRGAVTFFDSDRHGKTLVLHEKSDVHDRVTNGSLSSSSVRAEP